jgi:protein-tyrosine phosphatase
MAEFIFKDMVTRAGLSADFEIASAATSSEELGNPVYPPARRKLAEHGIDCSGKSARRIRRDDYDEWDLLIGFDGANLRNMERRFGGDPDGKIHLITEYAGRPGAYVDDPWYTRDFDLAWEDIHEGCLGLLNKLTPERTLDFSACRERAELYDMLVGRMLWQSDYGRNLDALYDILTGLPHLGRRFRILLPAEDAPCRGYAEIMVQVFEDAGAEVSCE